MEGRGAGRDKGLSLVLEVRGLKFWEVFLEKQKIKFLTLCLARQQSEFPSTF